MAMGLYFKVRRAFAQSLGWRTVTLCHHPHAFWKLPWSGTVHVRTHCLLWSSINRYLTWRHDIVPGNHWLCAKLQNHHSGSWELIVTSLFFHFTHRPQRAFASLFCCDQWSGPLSCARQGISAWFIWAITSKCHHVSCNGLHCRVLFNLCFEICRH